MTEAKNTVMNRKKKQELILERSHQQFVGNETQEDMLLKAQDEISFRAGRAEGYHEGFEDGVKDGYSAGQRKVVEWVNIRMFGNSNGYIFEDDPTFSLTVFHKQFHAQQKVWRL